MGKLRISRGCTMKQTGRQRFKLTTVDRDPGALFRHKGRTWECFAALFLRYSHAALGPDHRLGSSIFKPGECIIVPFTSTNDEHDVPF